MPLGPWIQHEVAYYFSALALGLLGGLGVGGWTSLALMTLVVVVRSLLSMHPDQHRFVHECLARGRVAGISPARLLPVLQNYRRCTLLSPDATARVTIYSNLQWYAMDAGRVNADGLVIIETKSAGPAHEIDRLLWSMEHRPTRISKYATGLAALRPGLPAHRWHRTLHTHLA